MTEHNNQPAFPLQSIDPVFVPGWSDMTLLDHFAGMTMQALIASGSTSPEIASTSYLMAEAMLKERAKWVKSQ